MSTRIAELGGTRGRGVVSTVAVRAGGIVYEDAPLVAVQATSSKPLVPVCARCLRHVEGLEAQVRCLAGVVQCAVLSV